MIANSNKYQKNMIVYKTVCKIVAISYFLLQQFIEAVLITFVALVFVFSVDKTSITMTTSPDFTDFCH